MLRITLTHLLMMEKPSRSSMQSLVPLFNLHDDYEDDEEEQDNDQDLVLQHEEIERQRCRGYKRSCGNKIRNEGKWCGQCYNRRIKDQDKRVREHIKQEQERVLSQKRRQDLELKHRRALAHLRAAREAALIEFRRQLEDVPLMIEDQRNKKKSPSLLVEEVIEPVEKPTEHIHAVPAASINTIPFEVASAVIQHLRVAFPQGNVTVAQLRAVEGCPLEWSDKLLGELIAAAAAVPKTV